MTEENKPTKEEEKILNYILGFFLFLFYKIQNYYYESSGRNDKYKK